LSGFIAFENDDRRGCHLCATSALDCAKPASTTYRLAKRACRRARPR
jgi:hypothetical protein